MTDAPLDLDRAARIGDVLRTVGYTEDALVGMLGAPVGAVAALQRLGPLLRRTTGGSPAETLARLFVGGRPVPAADVERAIAPTTIEDWIAVGLVAPAGADAVRSALTVRPSGSLLVVADIAKRPGDPDIARDYVMGLSPSTLGLAGLTVRRPNRWALDVGTGGGYQALRAAAHSERVVATDVNPRALRMAQLNLALNGIANVEVREGDLLEPARGERFDLIVSNPPFIVGPDVDHQFLSTSRAGDGVCRELAAGAGGLLTDGGYCQFLANWVSVHGEPWTDRLGRWFDGFEGDVWVIRASVDRPEEYASTWITAVTDDVDAYERRFAVWMDTFDREAVDAIAYGLVTMRRRAGGPPHWRRYDDVADLFDTGSGADLEHLVDARTWVAATDDPALMVTVFAVAEPTRVLLRMARQDTGLVNEDLVIKRTEGLRFGTNASPDLVRLVAALDGSQPLWQILHDVLGADADEGVERDVLAAVRELVNVGLVEPVGRT